MAKAVIVKIPDREREFTILGDAFWVNDSTGELTIFRLADPDDPDSGEVCAQFAAYTYAHMIDVLVERDADDDDDYEDYEDDDDDDEEDDDDDELTAALAVAARHGFVIDDAAGEYGTDDDDDDDDEEDDDSTDPENGQPASDSVEPDGASESVLVPVVVAEDVPPERVNSFSAPASVA